MTRLVYFDEAGTGSLQADPHLIIAGAMVQADRQWLSLEAYLRDMLEAYVPEGVSRPSHFHAKDIYHGTREFHRDRWPAAVRKELLVEMSKVPKLFDLPLFRAAIERERIAGLYPDAKPLEHDIHCYTLAATVCLMQVERYMRAQGEETEVAAAYFENNDRLRKRLKETHRFLRKPDLALLPDKLSEHYLPLAKIVDTLSFQEKTDASILQVADYCAFAVKRWKGGQSNADRLYGPIQTNFVMLDHNELADLGMEIES